MFSQWTRVNLNLNRTDPCAGPTLFLCRLGFNFDGAAGFFTVPGLSQSHFTYPTSLVQCASHIFYRAAKYICTCVCMYVRVYVCTCVCMYVRVYVCMLLITDKTVTIREIVTQFKKVTSVTNGLNIPYINCYNAECYFMPIVGRFLYFTGNAGHLNQCKILPSVESNFASNHGCQFSPETKYFIFYQKGIGERKNTQIDEQTNRCICEQMNR